MKKIFSKLSIRLSVFEIIFIISLCLSFYTRIGKSFNVNYFLKIIIASIWTFIAICKFIKCNKKIKMKYFLSKYKDYLIFIFPVIIMIIYNLVLIINGLVDTIYIGRMISNLYSMFIVVSFAISSSYLFKKRVFNLLVYSIILNFSTLFIINFYLYGFGCISELFLSIIGNINAINPFEVHDLTFAVGIIFIVFLMDYKRLSSFILVVISIIMLSGFKRIQILTLVACFIVYKFIKRISQKRKFTFLIIINICLIIGAFIYVIIIKTDLLNLICNFLGIETMGRVTLYNWISQYYNISPLYFGLGTGVTFKMTELLTSWGIYALHSDILRMYVEIGFIGFLSWLCYYLIFIPKYIQKFCTVKSLLIYFYSTLYLFLIHFTDNTVLYFTTQYVYTLTIVYFMKFSSMKEGEQSENIILTGCANK